MSKISAPISNDYCPQTLFLYGTYKEDGEPNFGLFCWFSYCWTEGLGVMACIGGSKLTLERIRKNKVFSANIVTEKCLPLADYFGTAYGYNEGKMDVPYEWEKGKVLDVPVLSCSPLAFELEVRQFVPLNDKNSELLICDVKNVLVDGELADESLTPEQKLALIAPVSTTCQTYFGWKGNAMGKWHEPGKSIMPQE